MNRKEKQEMIKYRILELESILNTMNHSRVLPIHVKIVNDSIALNKLIYKYLSR